MALNQAQLIAVPGGPGVVGAVKAGANITIAADGTISATSGGGGTITDVIAGAGLTGGGNTGAVTLNVGAGNGIVVAADTVGIDISVLPAIP